jgi:hypothetical protein
MTITMEEASEFGAPAEVETLRARVKELEWALCADPYEAREKLPKVEAQLADARSLVAEVAQGVTHWAGCTPELRCVRCERDESRAEAAEYDGVIVRGQKALGDAGVFAGADGSLHPGIATLQDERDAASREKVRFDALAERLSHRNHDLVTTIEKVREACTQPTWWITVQRAKAEILALLPTEVESLKAKLHERAGEQWIGEVEARERMVKAEAERDAAFEKIDRLSEDRRQAYADLRSELTCPSQSEGVHYCSHCDSSIGGDYIPDLVELAAAKALLPTDTTIESEGEALHSSLHRQWVGADTEASFEEWCRERLPYLPFT